MGNDSSGKSAFLGMSVGTAVSILRKILLCNLLVKYGENVCYRCNESIEHIDSLIIEHIRPWMYNDPALYWDTENVAYSHLSCNSKAGRQIQRMGARGAN